MKTNKYIIYTITLLFFILSNISLYSLPTELPNPEENDAAQATINVIQKLELVPVTGSYGAYYAIPTAIVQGTFATFPDNNYTNSFFIDGEEDYDISITISPDFSQEVTTGIKIFGKAGTGNPTILLGTIPSTSPVGTSLALPTQNLGHKRFMGKLYAFRFKYYEVDARQVVNPQEFVLNHTITLCYVF